jgi:anthranilate phosphoribosyltransferase
MTPILASLMKDIGDRRDAMRDLPGDDARALFAAMLAGEVPAAELRAILVAVAGHRGSVGQTIGFLRALAANAARLDAPADLPRPVVLPAHDGTRAQPNLTALLALLLARYGVPVVVHGLSDAAQRRPEPHSADRGMAGSRPDRAGRVTSAAVLWELGVPPAMDLADAQSRLVRHNIVYVPTGVLAPGLVRLLADVPQLDVRSSLHSLATLIDPFGGEGYRVVSVAHPDELPSIRAILTATGANALLLCGTEGEPFADPCRQPQLEHFVAGHGTVCAEAETAGVAARPALPAAIDAPTTAAWIAQALAGEQPLPAPIVAQLGCCLNGAHRAAAGAENRGNP